MPDPLTNNYSITLPTVGGDTNTWGGILNSGVMTVIDNVLGSSLAVSITTANVTLTTTQFQNKIFICSGTLTGNRSLIIPFSPNSLSVACGGHFVVVNNTAGAFNLTVSSAAGGTSVTVPQGFVASLYSDGTNIGYGTNGLPGFALASNGNPNGQLAGTAGSVNTNASIAVDYTTGNLWVCTTTGNAAGAVWTQPPLTVSRGFDTPVNLGLTVTHTGGNLLNLAIVQASGSNATALSPIIVEFQTVSGGNTTGLPTAVNITGALSMNTFATGATFGVPNNTPFRIWFALFNNAGTAVPAMGVFSASNGTIYPVAEQGVASTVSVSGSATSAGVWYTPNGTTLSNCAYRLIGYCEYVSGLATSGTYTSDPTNKVLFGPGVRKPGDSVQRTPVSSSTTQTGTNSTTYVALGPTQSISLTSPVNLVEVTIWGTAGVSSSTGELTIARGSTPIGIPMSITSSVDNLAFKALDAPGTTASTTYGVMGRQFSSGFTVYWPVSTTFPSGASIQVEEIMG